MVAPRTVLTHDLPERSTGKGRPRTYLPKSLDRREFLRDVGNESAMVIRYVEHLEAGRGAMSQWLKR